MQVRIDCKNEEEWLAERCNHIGGSDCAALLGVSKWKSNVDLYREKVGNLQRFVTNESIELGKRAEPALRELYSAYNPHMSIDYHQYTIIYQEELPFIASTLDGELTDEDGRKGILEIKTASLSRKTQWEEWDKRIPNHYLTQVLHQMISTGYESADLYACLTGIDGDSVIRTYRFERSDYVEDISWLTEKETEFWGYIQRKQMPPLILAI
jgi:putative phage-type endonuclease